MRITVSKDEAVAAMAAEPAGDEDERAAGDSIAASPPKTRAPFTEKRWQMVLGADGSCQSCEVHTRRSGEPVLEIVQGHLQDSEWSYPPIEVVNYNADPATSVSQAVWSKAAGRIGWPSFWPQLDSSQVKTGKTETRKV